MKYLAVMLGLPLSCWAMMDMSKDPESELLKTHLERIPVETVAVLEANPGLTHLSINPVEIENEIISILQERSNLKLALVPFSTSDKLCYHPYGSKLGGTNFAPSLNLLVRLAGYEGIFSTFFGVSSRPGMQAALLAATDDEIGFSKPDVKPNALRVVVVITTSPSDFAEQGKSRMFGDKRDHEADKAKAKEEGDDHSEDIDGDEDPYDKELTRPQSEACKRGPPDVDTVARVLEHSDIYMIVLAWGEETAKAWKTYGQAAQQGRYHVLSLPDATSFALAETEEKRSKLEPVFTSAAALNLKKSILKRTTEIAATLPSSTVAPAGAPGDRRVPVPGIPSGPGNQSPTETPIPDSSTTDDSHRSSAALSVEGLFGLGLVSLLVCSIAA